MAEVIIVHVDYAPIKGCKNPDTYGEICVKCNKCHRFNPHFKCLNCGHPLELTDKYCSNCSQLNSTKQLSINDFFQEFMSSIFTYDSRLRYTIKDLLLKPGTITRNYVNGQRLKYANPFRFFLSVSIIYFILQGFSSNFNTSKRRSW